jgi:hypothetical protein
VRSAACYGIIKLALVHYDIITDKKTAGVPVSFILSLLFGSSPLFAIGSKKYP